MKNKYSWLAAGTIAAGALIFSLSRPGKVEDHYIEPAPIASEIKSSDLKPKVIPTPVIGGSEPEPSAEESKLSLEQRLQFGFVSSEQGTPEYDKSIKGLIREFVNDDNYRPFEVGQLSGLISTEGLDLPISLREDSISQRRTDGNEENYGTRTGYFPNLIVNSKTADQKDHIARISFLNELGKLYANFNDGEKQEYVDAVTQILKSPNDLNQRHPSHRSYTLQAHVDLYIDNQDILGEDVAMPLGKFLDSRIDNHIDEANYALDNKPWFFTYEDSLIRIINPLRSYVEISEEIDLDPTKVARVKESLSRIDNVEGVAEKSYLRY